MLEDLKLRVMNVAKQAQREGMCKHKSGNFSARDEGTGLVVITPTSVDREDLVVPDMVVMDLDANVVENQTGLRPTSESLMRLRDRKPELLQGSHPGRSLWPSRHPRPCGLRCRLCQGS